MKAKITSRPKAKARPRTRTEPELTEREVDAFIARNRDALNASIRKSRAEAAQGIFARRSITQIIADGRKRAQVKKKT